MVSKTSHMKDIQGLLSAISKDLFTARKLVDAKIDSGNNWALKMHPWGKLGITDHITRDFTKIPFPQNSPVTVGDGPWPTFEFDEILKTLNITCYNMVGSNGRYADCEILVVGYETDRINDIKELLYHATDDVAIYPQELFIIYLLTGMDPLNQLSEKQIYEWIDFHPVLKKLSEDDDDFTWPTIVGGGGGGGGTIIFGSSSSPLTSMGYIVGNYSDLSIRERHSILEKIFTDEIDFPSDYSTAEKRAWGKPKTSTRLKKIAQHIARNISIRKGNKSYKIAVREWMEDLLWLKKTQAPKKPRFKWPKT